ncbi:hypothetical protein BGX26_012645 [Mortierella sp. AD094]|nr:hypothetical protein BGX26_012645 [Mortierella sp. AD094]
MPSHSTSHSTTISDSSHPLATNLSVLPSARPTRPTRPTTTRFNVRARTNPPSLLAFFILLSLNCLFSSLSNSPSSSPSLLLIKPCEAVPRNGNQRVDVPSPEQFPPLTGHEFSYTQQTPLGSLLDARSYADGALATQKLIAAPIIPINRQSWVGVDTRTAYFGNDYGGDKISNVSNLLQAGMRRLVVDLWWDSARLSWQLCPRLNGGTGQMSTIRMALEQGQKDLEASLRLRGMGNHQALAQEIQTEFGQLLPPTPPIINITHPDHKQHHRSQRINNNPGHKDKIIVVKRDATDSNNPDLNQTHDNPPSAHHNKKSRPDKGNVKSKDPPRGSRTSHDWFRKKKPQRPAIKPKVANQAPVNANKAASIPPNPSSENRGKLHRLAMNKGTVLSYDKSTATDQTADGITCSTGEDVYMLLQEIGTWIDQTTDNQFEDVLLIILNLNEIGNNTLGSRPPPAQSTPSPSPLNNGTNTTTGNPNITLVSNDDFFRSLVSPNTNKTVKALASNIISLKDLFTDAFPSLIYSPALLEMDRADLMSSWWKNNPVGLDYYNTTTDPTTGRVSAPTGWPTSLYLTRVIKRRIVVGFGSNNLQANTTYNITDDFTTLYAPGTLGPSMTNSSFFRISSLLDSQHCDNPMPGITMVPTGSEGIANQTESQTDGSETTSTKVSWSFSSMSDNDSSPWTYSSGQTATICGYSALVESRAPVLTFSEQTAMTIWSWDLDQPPINQSDSRDRRCGVMQSNGRWAVQDCNRRLPVACRKTNTSGEWIISDKGSANYEDVECPEGYMFDLPRTARENQLLYTTLLSYWNATVPSVFASFLEYQGRRVQNAIQLTSRGVPYAEDHDVALQKRYRRGEGDKDEEEGNEINDDDDDHDGTDSGNEGSKEQKGRPSSSPSLPNLRLRNPKSKTSEKEGVMLKNSQRTISPLTTIAGLPGEGMIWIDISSWQTAGCWVPGGPHGICPYQEPDNTVALREIIRVSTIGGVIILVVLAIFLYLNCRRNVRIRKSNKRRAGVRNKIMRTEVETVPA